ncbi:single-stranded DNA-binding protein [Pseudonocardia parietis]|uniref:Single-stranded DNA-binding protein n=1 Tax=Pseudonocardia parietis TaxID=570936 RepID=A0ABS4W645_9PSEU|nr:single-stranded DNA-binding protein [Pseudonocardia parietis]MBP2371682.1 single-strand DNA-binding protein [Pseudonocardia parietis]
MNEITLVGNIGKKPELVHSERTGDAVLRFSIAQNERYLDRQSGQWRDAKPVWTDVVAFRDLAENAAQSLHTGDAVIVIGKLADNSYTPAGEDREVRRTELRAQAIGPDLRRASTTLTRRPGRERTESTTAPQPTA